MCSKQRSNEEWKCALHCLACRWCCCVCCDPKFTENSCTWCTVVRHTQQRRNHANRSSRGFRSCQFVWGVLDVSQQSTKQSNQQFQGLSLPKTCNTNTASQSTEKQTNWNSPIGLFFVICCEIGPRQTACSKRRTAQPHKSVLFVANCLCCCFFVSRKTAKCCCDTQCATVRLSLSEHASSKARFQRNLHKAVSNRTADLSVKTKQPVTQAHWVPSKRESAELTVTD